MEQEWQPRNKMLMIRKAVGAIMLAAMICAVFICGACTDTPQRYPASHYTEEEHLANVTEKVRKRYIDGGFFEDFQIYPLYNAKEKLEFFLVDFEPQGFIYIRINYHQPAYGLVWTQDIYSVDSYGILRDKSAENFGVGYNKYERPSWRRYTVGEPNDPNDESYTNRHYETDENGDFIEYYDSHFKVAGIGDEKRYFLLNRGGIGGHYIPAVKRGEKYLNLVSMEEFECETKIDNKSYATADISIVPKFQSDL